MPDFNLSDYTTDLTSLGETTETPSITTTKVNNLTERKKDKLANLSGIKANDNQYAPETSEIGVLRPEKIVDGDTYRMSGDTNDTRAVGNNLDTYESSKGSYKDKWLQNPRNVARMDKQAAKLSVELGKPATWDDVFAAGDKRKLESRKQFGDYRNAEGKLLPSLVRNTSRKNINPDNKDPSNNYGRNLGYVEALGGPQTLEDGTEVNVPRAHIGSAESSAYGGKPQIASADELRKRMGMGPDTMSIEDSVRGALGTAGATAADLADVVLDAAGYLAQKTENAFDVEASGDNLGYGYQLDEDGKIRHYWSWEKAGFTSKQAFGKLTGAASEKFSKRSESFGNNIDAVWESDEGTLSKITGTIVAAYNHMDVIPEAIADSLSFVFALAKQPLAMVAAGTNAHLEERRTITGEAASVETTIATAGATAIEYGIDYIATKLSLGIGGKLGAVNKKVVDTFFKAVPKRDAESYIAKLLVKVATPVLRGGAVGTAAMVEEGSTEAIQETLGLLIERVGTEKYDKQKIWGLLDEDTQKQIRHAGYMGAFVGVGQSGIGKGVNVVRNSTSKQLMAEIDRRKAKKQNKTSAKVDPETDEGIIKPLTKEDKNQIIEVLTNAAKEDADLVKHAKVLEELEPKIGLLDPKNEYHAAAIANYKELQGKAVAAVRAMKEEEPIVFGSKEGAENAIIGIIESMDELDGEIDSKLLAIAKKHNISEDRYNKIKTMASVEYEVSTGKRGYLSYQKELNSLLSSANPDKKKVARITNNATRLLDSQVAYERELKSAITAAEQNVAAANKSGVLTGPRKYLLNKEIIKSTAWDVAIIGKVKGEFKVDPKSLELLEKKRQNIIGARAALGILTDTALESGIVNPADVGSTAYVIPEGEHTGKDTAIFKKAGVTKVITTAGVKEGKFGSDSMYSKTANNRKSTNAGSYNSSDIVYISAKGLPSNARGTKTAKGKDSFLTAIGNEIKKAMKAGATVVLDASMRKEDKAKINLQLTAYGDGTAAKGKYVAVKTDKNTNSMTYMPEIKATEVNEEKKKTYTANKDKKSKKAKMDDVVILQVAKMLASKADKEIIKALEKSAELKEHLKEYFSGDASKIFAMAKRKIDAQIEKSVARALEDEVTPESYGTVAKGDDKFASKDIRIVSTDIRALAVKEYKKRYEEQKDNQGLVELWKTATLNPESEEATYELELAISKLESNVLRDLLGKSISKGVKDVYQYMSKATDKVKAKIKTVFKLADVKEGGTDIRTRVMDITKIVKSKTKDDGFTATANILATLTPAQISTKVNKAAIKAQELLKSVIVSITTKATSKMTEAELKYADNKWKYMLADSPARGLFISKDENGNEYVNKTAALAAKLVLGEIATIDGYMLSDKPKSRTDLAQMLNKEEGQITKEMITAFSEKGMLLKTAANSAGNSFMTLMGLTRETEGVDMHMYETLKADVGSMIILMGLKTKALEVKTMPIEQYRKLVGLTKTEAAISGKDILFISGNEKSLEAEVTDYAEMDEELPGINTMRKEPSLVAFTKSEVERRASIIKKDKSGMTVAGEAARTIKELMKIAWKVDLDLIQQVLANKENILKQLGYIDLEDVDAMYEMRFELQEVQEAVNRDALKSIEELEKFAAIHGDTGSVEVYFPWNYIKNGRYELDSNTLNPQTDKLHRFITQPKRHAVTIKKVGEGFKVGNSDVTYGIQYSLAFAFGQKVDKKLTTDVKMWGDVLLGKNLKELEVIETAMLEEGKYAEVVDGVEIEWEAEHIAHTIQAINFLKDLQNGDKKIKTSLTAEYDAVTSGFGNKMGQMGGLLEDGWKEYVLKIGMVPESWLNAAKNDEKVEGISDATMEILKQFEALGDESAINDLFALGLPDSYQSLAIEMRDPSNIGFEELSKTSAAGKRSVVKKFGGMSLGNHKKVWEEIAEIIPKVKDGDVTSALRNLFKYPFMIFNYSAMMNTLRRNLTSDAIDSVIDTVLAADDNSKLVKTLNRLVAGDIKDALRTALPSDIQVRGGNLEALLVTMVQSSYGENFEEVMTKKFKPFLEVQQITNDAFTVMFQGYKLAYDAAMEEARGKNNGVITIVDYAQIIKNLRGRFPSIKGPLSSEEEQDIFDNIAIYKTASITPEGALMGQHRAATHMAPGVLKDQQTMSVAAKIKDFTVAISAGSVVPYHYIDGAHISSVVNELKGLAVTAIHDAVIPALDYSTEAQQAYNKSHYELNKRYNMLENIRDGLVRALEGVQWDDVKDVMVDRIGEDSISLREMYDEVLEELAPRIEAVNQWKAEFYGDAEENGFRGMHLGGSPEGVFRIEGKKSPKKGVKAEPKEEEAIITPENSKPETDEAFDKVIAILRKNSDLKPAIRASVREIVNEIYKANTNDGNAKQYTTRLEALINACK